MQGIYWRPQHVSRFQLLGVAVLSLAIMYGVENFQIKERQPYYREKLAAAKTARAAFSVLKSERLRRRIPIDLEVDPSNSGMVGTVISSITSGSGSLSSKRTAANPNFAAIVVHWLKRLQVQKGDVVAVGMSGSFPGANVATLAAIQAVGAEPLVISSVAASQWGANSPQFTWLDMETTLRRRGIFAYRSLAASRGGVGDEGIGISKAGRRALDEAIARSKVPLLQSDTVEESISKRLELYESASGERPIVAYINVGGGTVSVGTKIGKKNFRAGINRRVPRAVSQLPSVLGSFIKQGIPVIHVTNIISIAQKHGVEIAPTQAPEPGEGGIFEKGEPSVWLATVGITIIFGLMVWLFRLPYAVRLLAQQPAGDTNNKPV